MLHFVGLESIKMNYPAISAKISNFVEQALCAKLPALLDLLAAGDLYQVEQTLMSQVLNLYDHAMELILPAAATAFSESYQSEQGCQTRLREHSIMIATGSSVKLMSPYYRQGPCPQTGKSRRPLLDHWKVFGTATPLLCDRTAFLGMLAPSYDLASQGLKKFGVEICTSSARKITDAVGAECRKVGHEELIAKPGFSLSGKRVVISLDGGRTRVREYSGLVNSSGNEKFATPWREPKLFVIDILDEHGHPDRHELPIYGCRFSEDDVLASLRAYLKKFKIDKAQQVQLIADGACWIWKEVPGLIRGLGVNESRIVETLDYYHASEYVHELVKSMPTRVVKKHRQALLQEFNGLLQGGNPKVIVEKIAHEFKRPNKLVKRYLNYLKKHVKRMQYADYKALKLMCGSGIIESGVRRVINLRFKNASTFWHQDSVENLYFLRGALVAKRWNIVMSNLFS